MSRQEKLLRLKQNVASDQLKEELVQRGLSAQTQQVKRKTQELRARLGQTQKQTETRLRHVSVCGSRAAEKLQAAVAQVRPSPGSGETPAGPHLPLTRLCSRAGPEGPSHGEAVPPAGGPVRDRLVPSGGRRPADGENLGGLTKGLTFDLLPFLRQEPGEFPELRPLLRRRDGAVLRRETLRKQKDELLRENLQLRRLLRQYLEGKATQALPLAITQQAATPTSPPLRHHADNPRGQKARVQPVANRVKTRAVTVETSE